MTGNYFEVISLIERLHRKYLELVRFELDALGIHDINNVQAVMLFNLGNAKMTVGELMLRGCYLGSNVSYSVKKMVENGYLAQERSADDHRSILVQVTKKGRTLHGQLAHMHLRHLKLLDQTQSARADLERIVATLRGLENFWTLAGLSAAA